MADSRLRFVRGDIDGFFGLFVDNLLQLMLIAVLYGSVCGMPGELVFGRILPGAALSILFGNLFYAWQARRLAIRSGRSDVTALPYGINTVSLISFIFLIIAPIYFETRDPRLAWQAGLFACLISALLECVGAFLGDWLRSHTPRAALLSSLAGIAITFISMGFVFQIFAMPAGVQNRFGFGAANEFAAAYLIASLILVVLHYYNRGRESVRTGIVAWISHY